MNETISELAFKTVLEPVSPVLSLWPPGRVWPIDVSRHVLDLDKSFWLGTSDNCYGCLEASSSQHIAAGQIKAPFCTLRNAPLAP